jgi:hypothetical protein
MTKIENYLNSADEPMVKVIAEDGSCVCYTEQQYADYLAQVEQSTPIVINEAEAK